MSHKRFKQSLPLLLYDELSQSDRELLEEHLKRCEGCRLDWEELKQLPAALGERQPLEASSRLLADARLELELALRTEREKRSPWKRFSTFWLPGYAVAGVGVVTLVLGLFLGRMLLQPAPQDDPISQGAAEIRNVRFMDADAKDGVVEFSFETVTPVRVKGSVDDERVQRVLTYAATREQNPGVRLRALNALGAQPKKRGDSRVKEALIRALRSDENPGVRKEALRVLRQLPYDEQIKDTLLYVLMNDSNSGLRIAAINSLESAFAGEGQSDPETLDVLKKKMESDRNDYVRLQAANLIKEITR